uniref:Uncharacterized protein n=1 Tax=Faecalibaculum rodentium TaxID=1702221 RepID=A0A140DU12_9FIRM|nr:hypothetical protein AALO17_10050 [Faecalibaculum rodentium]
MAGTQKAEKRDRGMTPDRCVFADGRNHPERRRIARNCLQSSIDFPF